jgi:urease accessory protein
LRGNELGEMTETLPPAHSIHRAPLAGLVHDLVTLNYHERLIRRKRLITAHDESFVVDLAETVSLDHGDALVLTDGRLIEVIAAPEALMRVTGDLPRLAWHIGNRHAPCQIMPDALVLQRDKVMRGMLAGLGAEVTDIDAPFTPDGGAYGHGRTMGHSHAGPSQSHEH